MSESTANAETEKKKKQVKRQTQLEAPRPLPQNSAKRISGLKQIIYITPRIDAADNVVLKVGSEDTRCQSYLVSRNALILASPMWEELLSPELSATIDTTGFRLRKGDTGAAEIALLVAHSQFHKLPKELDIQSLAHLAIFADIYDLASLLKPFVVLWISALPLQPENKSSWMYEYRFLVARVFGDEADDQAALKEIIMHTTVDGANSLIWTTRGVQERELDHGCMPPEILASVYASRTLLFDHLIEFAIAFTWDSVIRCHMVGRERTTNAKSVNRCDLTILAFITMHLRQQEVMVIPSSFPQGKEEFVAAHSPFDFAQRLANVPVEYYKQHVADAEHHHCLDHVTDAFQRGLDDAIETFFDDPILDEEDYLAVYTH